MCLPPMTKTKRKDISSMWYSRVEIVEFRSLACISVRCIKKMDREQFEWVCSPSVGRFCVGSATPDTALGGRLIDDGLDAS